MAEELWQHWAVLVTALVAVVTLLWKITAAKREDSLTRAALELKVADIEKRFTEHMAEVIPLKKQMMEGLTDSAVVRQKVETLEITTTRLLSKMDDLIQTILEWRKNGSA